MTSAGRSLKPKQAKKRRRKKPRPARMQNKNHGLPGPSSGGPRGIFDKTPSPQTSGSTSVMPEEGDE